MVPRGFTSCVQHLPGATAGDVAVLLRTSWGQGHIPPWGHQRASSRPHAGAARAATVSGGWCLGAKVSVPGARLPQVVHVGSRELRALLEEPEAAASPLLCLSQSGPPSFLRPVTVQLPLPPGVTGERWPGGLAELMATGWRGPCSRQGSLCQGRLSLWPPRVTRPESGSRVSSPAVPDPS